MSKYLDKKVLLEWLEQGQQDESWDDLIRHGFFWVEHNIELGRFDAEIEHRLEQLDILQERLDRVAAIVDVIEQHDGLDATTLAQLRLALSWVPDKKVD